MVFLPKFYNFSSGDWGFSYVYYNVCKEYTTIGRRWINSTACGFFFLLRSPRGVEFGMLAFPQFTSDIIAKFGLRQLM